MARSHSPNTNTVHVHIMPEEGVRVQTKSRVRKPMQRS